MLLLRKHLRPRWETLVSTEPVSLILFSRRYTVLVFTEKHSAIPFASCVLFHLSSMCIILLNCYNYPLPPFADIYFIIISICFECNSCNTFSLKIFFVNNVTINSKRILLACIKLDFFCFRTDIIKCPLTFPI